MACDSVCPVPPVFDNPLLIESSCQTTSAGTAPTIVSGAAVSTSGLTEWQVVAHEIGHNFGAIVSSASLPRLDPCPNYHHYVARRRLACYPHVLAILHNIFSVPTTAQRARLVVP